VQRRDLITGMIGLLAAGAALRSETVTTGGGDDPAGIYSTDESVATTLPVSGAAGVSQPWLARLAIPDPVAPGDILEVDAQARVTSELNYNVGVGYHLWAFVVGASTGKWWRISPLNGDNVNLARHHMPLHCDAVWTVPADWPAGGCPAIVYRGDAHSTAWQPGHKITNDHGYGLIKGWAPTPQ
jgi:hypothetical protein